MIAAIKTFLRPVKRRALVALGKDLSFVPEAAVETEFHGTEYGGFAILKDSIGPSSVVLSCGIGEDASFDLSLIEKYGCTVHAFDPTPKSVQWVHRTIREARFVFQDTAIADRDGELRLFLPRQSNWVSASLQRGGHTSDVFVDVKARRLTTIIAELGVPSVDVLKMDIEGAEYSVLADYLTGSADALPGQLALEFHHFYPEFGLEASRAAVRSLRAKGYRLCWVSPSHHELLFVAERLLVGT